MKETFTDTSEAVLRLSSRSLVGEVARGLVRPRRARGQRNPQRGCFSASTAFCGCQRASADAFALYPAADGDAPGKSGGGEEPSGSGITGRRGGGWLKARRRTGSAVAAAIGSQGPDGLAGRGPDGDGFRRQTPQDGRTDYRVRCSARRRPVKMTTVHAVAMA